MELLQAIVLGIVQGITEFLPISSDGHLILVPSLLGWPRFGLGFDVMVHAGTLLATVLYFRKDVGALASSLARRDDARSADRRLALLLLGATVPSVVVVFALEPFVEGVEQRPVPEQIAIAAWGLIATTIVLGLSEVLAARQHARGVSDDRSEDLAPVKALLIGFAQGFAALPGLSRSGTTIAAGQSLGMTRGEAARFSFLLSIPIIAAATVKKSLDIAQGPEALPGLAATVLGVGVTTAVGYGVIWFLLPFVRRHSLWWFAAYTGIAGILLLATYGSAL